MKTSERREEIIKLLKKTEGPLPAKDLAEKFNVSRQVIVQDLAVIRASLPGIMATNRGYVLQNVQSCCREFKVRHDHERMEEELNVFVDYGGIVKNVSISHRVYGRVTAQMDIRSRQDVQDYIDRLNDSQSTLLGDATSGYHYHLIEATNEERLDKIEGKLKEIGLLVPLLPWEKEQAGIK